MRKLVAGVLLAAVAACSSSNPMKPRPTPSDPLLALYRANFLHSCETDASAPRQTYCECTEDALEARFDIKQLRRLMKVPALRKQFVSITHTCAASAGLPLRR